MELKLQRISKQIAFNQKGITFNSMHSFTTSAYIFFMTYRFKRKHTVNMRRKVHNERVFCLFVCLFVCCCFFFLQKSDDRKKNFSWPLTLLVSKSSTYKIVLVNRLGLVWLKLLILWETRSKSHITLDVCFYYLLIGFFGYKRK
jgi:hypothetical protein